MALVVSKTVSGIKSVQTKPCKHKYILGSFNLKFKTMYCQNCPDKITKNLTKAEFKKYKAKFKKDSANSKALHALWSKFCKTVMAGKVNKKTKKHEYKYKGYDMMIQARKFAKNHPEVSIAGVDDDRFCNSSLVFIPSKRKGDYMGCNVVYIPQCTNEDPTTFFLYPGHTRNILEALSTQVKYIPKKGLHTWKKRKTYKLTL